MSYYPLPTNHGIASTALTDFSPTAPTATGQVPVWDNVALRYAPGAGGGGGSSTLVGLTDVQVAPGPAIDGRALQWSNSAGKWVSNPTAPVTSVCGKTGAVTVGLSTGDLTDVTNVAPSNNNYLRWTTALGKWSPAAAPVTSVAGRFGTIVLTTADMTNISTTAPTDGQRLAWVASTSKWTPTSPTLAAAVDCLFVGLTNGQVLTYDSASGKWKNATVPAGVTTLAGLSDVQISSPSNGQVLTFSSVAAKWLPVSPQAWRLDTLGDCAISGQTTGDTVTYSSLDGLWHSGKCIYNALNGLTDVSVVEGPGINGYTLNWNNSTSKWVAVAPVSGGTTALAGLTTDVAISGPTNAQVLLYDSGTSKWKNATNPAFDPNIETITLGLGANNHGQPDNYRNTLLGAYTSVSAGGYCTAIGTGASCNGSYALAIGLNASCSNGATLSFGNNSQGSGANSIAMGASAVASGGWALAIGQGAGASHLNSIVICTNSGNGASSTANGSLIVSNMRNNTGTGNWMWWNATTREISYSTNPAVADMQPIALNGSMRVFGNTNTGADTTWGINLQVGIVSGLVVGAGASHNNNISNFLLTTAAGIDNTGSTQQSATSASWTYPCDGRLKTDVVPLDAAEAEERFLALRLYSYRRVDLDPRRLRAGFVAQELRDIPYYGERCVRENVMPERTDRETGEMFVPLCVDEEAVRIDAYLLIQDLLRRVALLEKNSAAPRRRSGAKRRRSRQ